MQFSSMNLIRMSNFLNYFSIIDEEKGKISHQEASELEKSKHTARETGGFHTRQQCTDITDKPLFKKALKSKTWIQLSKTKLHGMWQNGLVY